MTSIDSKTWSLWCAAERLPYPLMNSLPSLLSVHVPLADQSVVSKS